jgi:hypothetical protein
MFFVLGTAFGFMLGAEIERRPRGIAGYSAPARPRPSPPHGFVSAIRRPSIPPMRSIYGP